MASYTHSTEYNTNNKGHNKQDTYKTNNRILKSLSYIIIIIIIIISNLSVIICLMKISE